jgi:hypothetical protein
MKTILNDKDKNLVINRISSLSEKADALWGRMNVNEMICHCTDQIRMAEGKIDIKFVGNYFLTKIMKNLILLGMPAPKGKVKTYKELDQKVRGTKTTIFESDRKVLIEAITNFEDEYPIKKNVIHPSFGELSMSQWGRLIYIHLDHHLRQFGV